MGYCTDFTLRIHSGKVQSAPNFITKLNDISGYEWDDEFAVYDAKWYSWDHDMKAISRQYPDVVFELEGNGEEGGDIWKAYFKNGKMQTCKAVITFEKFDPTKLIG